MSKYTLKLFMRVLLIFVFYTGSLSAQEIQIPFCDQIEVITASMAKGVDFFADYPGFQQATVYKTPDNTLVMEIVYKQNGATVKERKSATTEMLEKVCTQLKEKTAGKAKEEYDPDFDGKRKIIGSTMAYSLLYYAWAFPTALEMKDATSILGSYLLIGSAGFFIPMLATQNTEISKGMAKGYTYGCFLGIAHGAALGTLFDPKGEGNTTLGISALVSISEGLIGLNYARNHQLNRAHMRTIGSMGTWGLFYGLGIPAMAESDDNTAYAASALGVSIGGMIAGDHLATKFKPTEGDITVINGMGIGGTMVIPTIIGTVAEDISPFAGIGLSILGSVTSLGMGFHKTSKINYSRSEGNILLLGEFAGALIGAGISVLGSTDDKTTPWLITGGLAGGFFATDAVIKRKKKTDNTMGLNLSFDFNPLALQRIITKETYSIKPGKPLFNADLAKVTLHL